MRGYLVGWLITVGCTFFGVWLGLGSLIFSMLIVTFLIAAPWYLLRRMAERRRQKIEDQLADAMVTFANAVRAGLTMAQAMEIFGRPVPEAD